MREGKADLAIDVFRLGAAAFPQNVDVFDSLADAYLAKADSAGARAAYEHVLQLLPSDTSLSASQQREYRERAESFLRVQRPTTVFVDVNVLPMDRDSLLTRQNVVVSGDRIVAMGPTNSTPIPTGALRISGGGTAFLIPGLVDAHVHLEFNERRWLPVFLAYGVTTVLNLRGKERHLALREALASGRVIGPSVLTSGPYTNQPEIATADDARRAVAEHKRLGYDVIKIHGDLTADVYHTLVEEATKAGIPVVGHAPRNLPFDSVIAMRQAMVAHAEELIYTHFQIPVDTAGIGRVGERMRNADIWLTPNLSAFSLIVSQIGRPAVIDSFVRVAPPAFLAASIDSSWRSGLYTARPLASAPRYQQAYTFLVAITGALHRSGVRMLAGTDTPLPGLAPGQSLLLELRLLQVAGLGPFAALQTATANAGEFIATRVRPAGPPIGVVRTGGAADLVLVSRNPLQDMSALEKPLGVMARGRWYDRAKLDAFAGRK
jgi:hypothetical protein